MLNKKLLPILLKSEQTGLRNPSVGSTLTGASALNITHTLNADLNQVVPFFDPGRRMLRRRLLPILQHLPQEELHRKISGHSVGGPGDTLLGASALNIVHTMSNLGVLDVAGQSVFTHTYDMSKTGSLNIGGNEIDGGLNMVHTLSPLVVLDIGGAIGKNIIFTLDSEGNTSTAHSGASALNIIHTLAANGVLDLGGNEISGGGMNIVHTLSPLGTLNIGGVVGKIITFTLDSNSVLSGLHEGQTDLNIILTLAANGSMTLGGNVIDSGFNIVHTLSPLGVLDIGGVVGKNIIFTLDSEGGTFSIHSGESSFNVIHTLAANGALDIGGNNVGISGEGFNIVHTLSQLGVLDIAGTNIYDVTLILGSDGSSTADVEGASVFNIIHTLAANGVLDIAGRIGLSNIYTLGSNTSGINLGGNTINNGLNILLTFDSITNHMTWAGPIDLNMVFTLSSLLSKRPLENQTVRFQLCLGQQKRYQLNMGQSKRFRLEY